MAKRKRLEPVPGYERQALTEKDQATTAEVRSSLPPFGPPIARIAQDAAREAALEELSTTLAQARAEGRLVQKVELTRIDLDHLLRDRIGVDEDEMSPLLDSLRARGQQTPIEVVPLDDGRFGLISGWRRVLALRRLHAETGDERFATALALLRQPRDAAEAYVAMVEENEIRLGLSYYERARIVARAVSEGVFEDRQTALRSLFSAGSRARRSKIGSFLTVVDALDGDIRFPMRLGERLGLALAQRLNSDPGFAAQLRKDLLAAKPEEPEAEIAVLDSALKRGASKISDQPPEPASNERKKSTASLTPEPTEEEVAPGIRVKISGRLDQSVLTLSGPNVDQAFKARLIDWLQAQE